MLAALVVDNSMICQAGFSTVPPLLPVWDCPRMNGTKELLRSRVREKLDETGRKPRSLSLAIGAAEGYVRDLLDPEKTSMPSAERLQRIAAELGTTTDWLLGKSDSPDQPRSEVSFRDMPVQFRGSEVEGIPLVGTAWCDDLAVEGEDGGRYNVERVLLEVDHTVRMIARPPALWAARDAYAIYFHGASMEPRFRQGDIGVVDPRRPPAPGDDVLVQLNDGIGGSDVMTVLVKELVRITSTEVRLRQYNPATVFGIPRRQVARLHRIVSVAELLGG